jgi:HK97 family phage major capsid protein
MKSLKELKAELTEAKNDGRALITTADAEGRELTAAEEAKFSAIESQIAALEKDIAAAEKMADRRRKMDGPSAHAIDVASGRVEVGADRATLDRTGGFRSLAEFATAVRNAHPENPTATVDGRLRQSYGAAPGDYHREGGSNDGYHVPPEYRDRIWENVFAADNLLSEVDAEPTNSNQVNDLTDETTPWGATGVKAYWRAEGSQMTATRETVKPRSCILHPLYAMVQASDELLEDAPRLNSRLEMKAAEAITWKIDDAIINGDGVGKPLGWMKSAALITVAKETGQAADTLVIDNLTKMFSRLLPQGLSRSHWRINSDVLPQLIGLKLGDHAIWTPPASGITNAPGGFLFGRPIRLTEHCATLGDKGDIQLVDPKGYYALRKEGGIKFASSIHLYFDYGVQAFRWTVRLGGQPHLSAPVSPKNGTTTKSHFVTLAERA